jgi:hypothetical protein
LCGAPGAAAQDGDSPASRIEAPQISAPGTGAFLDDRLAAAALDTASPMPREGDQISRGSGSAPASQISSRGQSGPRVAQLSSADLDASLAQLSAAERRVLLQAIDGTDICDDPPQVATIVALCLSRLETRSGEFAARPEGALSAEERLLRGDLEGSGLPSVGQVIERLARGSAASDDFSNQAIASIALAAPAPASPGPDEEESPNGLGLGEEAQGLINAIINQLGGGAP